MPKGYYRQVVSLLKGGGFTYHRNCKGSHEMWRHPGRQISVVVPHNIPSRHTANAILKDAGLASKKIN